MCHKLTSILLVWTYIRFRSDIFIQISTESNPKYRKPVINNKFYILQNVK